MIRKIIPKPKMVSRICPVCQNKFKARAVDVRRGGGIFCSQKCSQAASRKEGRRAYLQENEQIKKISFQEAIKEVLNNNEQIAILKNLISIAKQKKNPQAAISASRELFDRFIGKPKQSMEMESDQIQVILGPAPEII